MVTSRSLCGYRAGSKRDNKTDRPANASSRRSFRIDPSPEREKKQLKTDDTLQYLKRHTVVRRECQKLKRKGFKQYSLKKMGK